MATKKIICGIFLFFAISGGMAILGQSGNSPVTTPPSISNGQIDLRNYDFSQGAVNLTGQWKFYWNQMLMPHEDSQKFEYEQFPDLWQNLTWGGRQIPSTGFASYKIRLFLSKEHHALALKIPSFYCSYRLYLNNKLVANNGTPGKSKLESLPYWSTQVKSLPVYADTVEILLQISNFHHTKGGAKHAIQLGTFDDLQSEHSLSNALDFFLAGCSLMGGLFFLALYRAGSRDKAILYFSLFSLLYNYRIIGSGNYALHSLVPGLDWGTAIRLEYITLFISVAMFCRYTRNLFPDETPKTIFELLTKICVVCTGIALVFPPTLSGWLIDPFLMVLGVYMLMGTVSYWRAYRKNRAGATLALLSTGVLFSIASCSILEYYGTYICFDNYLALGYLGFFVFQSLILSKRFACSLMLAKDQASSGLKAKSDFLSIISHEIRTPLNSVIGMSCLLREAEPREDQVKYLEILQFSAKNLLNIVNDVLFLSSIDAGKVRLVKEAMDLDSLIKKIVSVHSAEAARKKIAFLVEYDPEIPFLVEGDITRTTQVLDNLLYNAVKFTNHGNVCLSVQLINRLERESTLKFSVSDTGIGIPVSKQKEIFERFAQADSAISRDYGGTGLGLAICKEILNSQGVELLVKSEEGAGSVFYFVQQFRTLSEKRPEQVDLSFGNQLPLQNVHILVVEDTLANVVVIQNFLRKWGASCDIAKNGEEAVQMVVSSKNYQLILMDLHMPVMDGYQATEILRSRGVVMPIIALTADVSEDVEAKIFKAGMNLLVQKPFNPDTLLKTILRITGAKR